MRYIPNYQLNIIPEEKFAVSIKQLESELNNIKNTGSFTAFDGINIYYEYFLAEKSRGNIVIVHGLSEFTKKFYEFIFYALNQGYNLFVYDQRCHGLSGRLTDERDLLHVDSFQDYVKDLTYFIDEIVLKTENKPLYLYTNSMGGAVGALYLAQNKNKIKKAIFSVPMFEPVVNSVPTWLARFSVGLTAMILGPKRKFFLSKEFDPNVEFNHAKGLSEARFESNMNLRKINPCYRSTPMSYGWVKNSLIISKRIFKTKFIKKIETPLLLISAKEDKVVNNNLQIKFSKKCQNCKFESIDNATHTILAGDEKILHQVMNLIFDFISEQ